LIDLTKAFDTLIDCGILFIQRYAAVCGLSMVERYKKKALILSNKHANEDIVQRALKLLEALSD